MAGMVDPLPSQLSSGFDGLWVRQELPYGHLLAGRDPHGEPVTIAVLSAAASADPHLRAAFADAVWRRRVIPGGALSAAEPHGARPWAAVRTLPGESGAEQLLEELVGTALTSPGLAASVPDASSLPTEQQCPAAGPSPSPVPATPTPGPGQGRSRVPVLLGFAGAVMALVLALAGTAVAVQVFGGAGDSEDRDNGLVLPTAPVIGTSPTAGADDPAPLPTLRSVEEVSVLGPTFGRVDETYTMQFEGWPFAFRAPHDWNCIGGQFTPAPDADVRACTGDGTQLLYVMLWECEAGCSPQEQEQMVTLWLREPEQPVHPAGLPEVTYVEIEEDEQGRNAVMSGHFIGETPGAEPRWMVGVHVASPPETLDDVLKMLNDVVSQSR